MGKFDAIVVTIPKDEVAAVEAEELETENDIINKNFKRGDTYYWWSLSSLPVGEPKKIYFVWGGAVRAYHVIWRINRYKRRIEMDTVIYNLKNPIPMKGFRGFRYFDESILKEG